MLEWTYNVSKVTAYVTKKPHRATDGFFCYPLKGLTITSYVS